MCIRDSVLILVAAHELPGSFATLVASGMTDVGGDVGAERNGDRPTVHNACVDPEKCFLHEIVRIEIGESACRTNR